MRRLKTVTFPSSAAAFVHLARRVRNGRHRDFDVGAARHRGSAPPARPLPGARLEARAMGYDGLRAARGAQRAVHREPKDPRASFERDRGAATAGFRPRRGPARRPSRLRRRPERRRTAAFLDAEEAARRGAGPLALRSSRRDRAWWRLWRIRRPGVAKRRAAAARPVRGRVVTTAGAAAGMPPRRDGENPRGAARNDRRRRISIRARGRRRRSVVR